MAGEIWPWVALCWKELQQIFWDDKRCGFTTSSFKEANDTGVGSCFCLATRRASQSSPCTPKEHSSGYAQCGLSLGLANGGLHVCNVLGRSDEDWWISLRLQRGSCSSFRCKSWRSSYSGEDKRTKITGKSGKASKCANKSVWHSTSGVDSLQRFFAKGSFVEFVSSNIAKEIWSNFTRTGTANDSRQLG